MRDDEMTNWYRKADMDFKSIDPEEDYEEGAEADQVFNQSKIKYPRDSQVREVAIENGVVIGALSCGWQESQDYEPEKVYVYSFDLAVKPEFRRQGVGATLIQRGIAQYESEKHDYQDMGYSTMMRVWVVNPVLIPLLENKFGFQMEAEHEGGSAHLIRY